MSNWPEPTPDETEPPRWGRAAAVIVLAAIAAYIIFSGDRLGSREQSTRLPEIALRGGEEPPPPEASEDIAAPSPDLFSADLDGPVTRPVPFKDCLSLIFDTGNMAGIEPVLTEQSAGRVIARLPRQDGGVTITCSARDGTMTIEHGAAGTSP